MKSPDCKVLSLMTKSNLLQDISFHSSGTETNIKDYYSAVINSSNMYFEPFLRTDSTSHVFQSSEPFQGNAKAVCHNLLHVKTEDLYISNLPPVTKEN